jgi:hypothetical protein
MKGETKGTQAERCKRAKHHVPINQRELKKGRHKEVSKLRPRKMSPERCFQREQEALVWRRIISKKWK